jgi:hypothetical protein
MLLVRIARQTGCCGLVDGWLGVRVSDGLVPLMVMEKGPGGSALLGWHVL